MSITVVKVGGSLYDCGNLGPCLRRFLAALQKPVLVVPGGGPTADAIRLLDSIHQLGDEAAHWLALQSCQLNGRFLATILQPISFTAAVVGTHENAVVDLHGFALDDERRPDHLPHRWDVTSDSLAVRVAAVAGARELVLLKSIDVESDWIKAVAKGSVDPYFPTARESTPHLRVRAVNFRRVLAEGV